METKEITVFMDEEPKKTRRWWFIQAGLPVIWLIQGYFALQSYGGSWQEAFGYFQIITGALLGVTWMFITFRPKHGRMRLRLTENEIEIKDTETDHPGTAKWSDVDEIAFGVNQIFLTKAAEVILEVKLAGSYAVNQEIQTAVKAFAEAKNTKLGAY